MTETKDESLNQNKEGAVEVDEIKLGEKIVGDIHGIFNIPSYQRGYRWGEEEVTRLLEDIYGIFDKDTQVIRNYWLQPVVVKKNGESYDLIDGQQRLTTIYLIYKYMSVYSRGFLLEKPGFSIKYDTRNESEQFLKTMDMTLREDNIDFWFMANAYETIEKWFHKQKREVSVVMGDMNAFLAKNVKVIWYEVGEAEDAIALFERLNIGKIALTSAELVKAMFLCRTDDEEMDQKRQEEIALQWDNMEKELHNEALWYFLTNNLENTYQTRIDLVLDLISKKTDAKLGKYFTYFKFDKMKKKKKLADIWTEILHTFLILKEWFGSHELYHKIGYLIASRTKSLLDIYEASKGITKKDFLKLLDSFIRDSIDIEKNYGELSYNRPNECIQISRLLLLFNVESVRRNGKGTQWFPFDKFKFVGRDKVVWSLEHIHAQQSEGMKTEEEWRKWLELHLESIQAVGGYEELTEKMKNTLNKKKIDGGEFKKLQQEVFEKMSAQGNAEYLHSISNLALLNSSNNAALSNSIFAVKRNKIIEMDKSGEFIPFCTKMVFLKYYTPSENNQLHFWGQADREAYIMEINKVLKDYLNDEITLEKEGIE